MSYATGKRKMSVAKVRLIDTTALKQKPEAPIVVNGYCSEEYFKTQRFTNVVTRPIDFLLSVFEIIKSMPGEAADKVSEKFTSYKLTRGEKDYINSFSQENIELLALQLKGLCFVVDVHGGGISAQADATLHGISKIIDSLDSKFTKFLRMFKFLTRDSRIVERKKCGKPKARKSEQYSKR